MELHTIVGLFGVFCYVLAYALIQLRKLKIDSWNYAYLNITGSSFSLYSLSHDFNLAAVICQSAWLIFTLIGMHTSYRHRDTMNNKKPPMDVH